MDIADKNTYDNLIKMIEEVQDYAIILLDTEGTVRNWNVGAKRIKGYTRDEVIGKNFSMFYTTTDVQNNKPQELLELAKKEGKVIDNGWRMKKDGTSFGQTSPLRLYMMIKALLLDLES